MFLKRGNATFKRGTPIKPERIDYRKGVNQKEDLGEQRVQKVFKRSVRHWLTLRSARLLQ